MGRDIRIEEVNGGYILRAYEPPKDKASAEIMYDSMTQQKNEIVVATADEAKACIQKWLNNEAPPFKKSDVQ